MVWYFILKTQGYITADKTLLKNWFWLFIFSPLLGLGSMIGTPDVPLVFFWSLSFLVFQKLILKPESSINYILLGITLGLGFCSKYHIVLFVPLIFIFLILNLNYFKQIRWRFVPLTLFFGLVFSFPVVFWNYQNNFQSFRFQWEHGFTKEPFNYQWPLLYLIGQLMIISPFLIPVLYRAHRTNPRSFHQSLNSIFGWGPLIFFLLTSFKGHVEANWPVIAVPPLLILSATQLNNFLKLKKIHFTFFGFLYLLIFAYYLNPKIPFLHEKLKEPLKYSQLVPLIEKYEPLYASKYQMASTLWSLTKKPFYKLPEMSRYDFFDTLLLKENVSIPFYLILERGDNLPGWILERKLSTQEISFTSEDFKILKIF